MRFKLMKMFCVTGDNFYDVVGAQIGLVGDGLKQGKKQLILVPDKYIFDTQNRILKELNLTASFDIEVQSLSGLCTKLLYIDEVENLSPFSGSMVIERILNEHSSELKCFVNTAKTIAFADVLYKVIMQLKDCKITPQNLFGCVDNINNSALKLKLYDIALIYNYYENFLGNEFVDSNCRLQLLCNALKQNKELENKEVHFCYYEFLTECELDVFKILAQRAGKVSVGVLYPKKEQNNLSCYTCELYNRIVEIVKELEISTTYLSAENSMPKFGSHILHNTFAVNPQKMELEDNKSIYIFSATGLTNEVEFIAQDIISKVQAGARFKDFVVSTTNMETYFAIFARVFDKYHIPFFADSSFAMSDSEGAKFVLSALDCVLNNFQVADVLKYAKNSLSGLSAKDYAIFENVIYHYGIDGDRFMDNDKPNCDDADFDRYLDIKNLLKPLFNLNVNLQKSVTVCEMIEAIRLFFEESQLEINLNGMALSFREKGELFKVNIARQNFAKLDGILSQMLAILGDVPINLMQFTKIFKAGLKNITLSSLSRSVDCVFVGQCLSSVFERAENFYITGAIDGTLPSWVADTGLLSDYDIAELAQNNIKLTPSTRLVNARNKSNVLQSLGYANRCLTITYPVNMDGQECKPASFIDDICNNFTHNGRKLPIVFLGEMLQDDNAFGGQVDRLDFLWKSPINMLRGVVEAVQDENSTVDPTILASSVKFLKSKGYGAILDEILKLMNNEKTIEKLQEPTSVFFTNGKARVTQIEKFFECPYAHFLNYGLKLQQRRTSRPEAVDVGNILHAVFEKFGYNCKENIPNEAEIEKIVPQIFDKVLMRKDFCHITFSKQNDTMLATLKEEAVRACKAIAYQLVHSEYKIKFIETSFGVDGFAREPEVAVINTNHKIKISGKIDRADVWNTKLRIIDYKTSKNSGSFSLVNFYLGKKIQLFYYMQAIVEDLKLTAGGAYYLPVHREYSEEGKSTKYSSFKLDGVSLYTDANMFAQDNQVNFDHPSSDIVDFTISTSKDNVENDKIVLSKTQSSKLRSADEEQIKLLLKYAKEVLEGAINDIYGGEISPLYIGSACDFCAYKNICRKDILPCAKERRSDFDVKLDSFGTGEENGV